MSAAGIRMTPKWRPATEPQGTTACSNPQQPVHTVRAPHLTHVEQAGAIKRDVAHVAVAKGGGGPAADVCAGCAHGLDAVAAAGQVQDV